MNRVILRLPFSFAGRMTTPCFHVINVVHGIVVKAAPAPDLAATRIFPSVILRLSQCFFKASLLRVLDGVNVTRVNGSVT